MSKRTKTKSLRVGFVIHAWVELDVPRPHSGSLEEALAWAKTVDTGTLLAEDVTLNDGHSRVQQVYDEIGDLES